MHQEAKDFVRRCVDGLVPQVVVELGSYDVNGSVRELFPYCNRYIGVDVRAGPGVDVVADGAAFQPDTAPDVVVSCEVLEHIPPTLQYAVVHNAYQMLASGGRLILTAATDPRPAHSVDGWGWTPEQGYWNVQEPDLWGWLQAERPETVDYQVIVDDARGDIYAWAIKP